MLSFQIFEPYPELRYGMSEKSDGSMKIVPAKGEEELIQKNRERYFTGEKVAVDKTVRALLARGATAKVVGEQERGQIIANIDSLVSKADDVFLSITVADCFPVYLYDPKARVIGLVHAGWGGIGMGVIGGTVEALAKAGASPGELRVAIGPGIQSCHFEVKQDVASIFAPWPVAMIKKDKKIFLDLPSVITKQLQKAGVSSAQIENCGKCTYCMEETYFSYRREKPQIIQVMLAYLGMSDA